MPQIPIPGYMPDRPAYQNEGSTEALNVVPRLVGVGPLASLQAQTTEALTGRVMGAWAGRDITNTAHMFAADATMIQKMESGGLTWDDVSRTVGGAYAAVNRWSFTQFGNRVLAANGVDAMQTYTLGSSTDFAALGGSSPIARYLTGVRDFVVAAAISSNLRRVQWPAINDPTDWVTSATTQADQQDLPEGGNITGIVGGEFGTIFQERAVTRMTYTGPPTIFQFDTLLRDVGCSAPGSIAAHANDCYFLSDDGLKALRGMAQLEHVGREQVDRALWDELDQTYLERVTSTIDPVTGLYMMAYPGSGNVSGTPNKGLIFNPHVGRFARFEENIEMLFSAVQAASAYTLDGLDAVSSSIDTLMRSLDDPIWTGRGRPFLAAFTTAHKLGLFSGAPMAVTADTAETQLVPGRRSTVTSIRPIGDASAISSRIGARNLQSEAVTWSAASAQNAYGMCPTLADGRYHRARLQIAAGVSWTELLGIDDVEFAPGGAI